MQQAIIWLKKAIRVAGDEISIIVADVVVVESDDRVAVVRVGMNDTLNVEFDAMISGADMTPNLCLITNASGEFINGAADIRVVDPASL